jgi:DNA repair exonuclease SbcCD nuclease subunit
MVVKILVIGDPHIKAKDIIACDAMMNDIIKIAKDGNYDAIISLGDTLHNHERVNTNPLARSIKFYRTLSLISPLYVLIGNHDLRNNQVYMEEEPEHPFTALKYWENTTIIDNTTLFEIKGRKFMGVPYVPPGRFFEAIGDVDLEEITCVFAHQELKGAKVGNTYSTEGDKWLETYPLIVCGHIHEANEQAKNIIYIGTPMQQNFGESDNKAIAVFSWSDNSKEAKYERLELPNVPKRKEYFLNCGDLTTLEDIVEKSKTGVYLIKIHISGTSEEIKSACSSKLFKSVKNIPGTLIIKDVTNIDFDVEDYKEDDTKKIIADEKTFKKLILSSIDGEVAVLKLYEELFGK